jgi:type IV secretory pathway VirB2 component (pilin)
MKLSLVHVFDTRAVRAAQAVLVGWLLFRPAAASGQPSGGGSGGMPWDSQLQTLVADFTGPVAKAIGIVAIVSLGIGIAFSEGGSMLRKALFVVFGLTLTFSAATFVLPFLGFTGQ